MAYTGVVSTVRSSATALAANTKPDIDSVLRLIKPYQTPLMQWLFFSNKQSKVVLNKNSKFSWFEDEYLPHQTTVTAAVNLTSTYYLNLTSSNCADVSFFKLYDLVYIEANDELAFVSTVTSSTDITLTKVHATIPTALTAIAAGDIGSYVKIVGSWNLENNEKTTSLTTQEVEVYNYCTIFNEGIGSTGRDQAGENYTDGKTHDEEVMKKMEEMKLMYERNFLFSNVAATTGTTTATKKTIGKGLKGFFTSNAVSYAGAISEVALDNFFSQVFAKGSQNRTFVVGNNLFNGIAKIAKDKQGSFPSVIDSSYGGRVNTYIHGMGDVKIVRNSLMDGKFANAGFIYQEDQIIPRHMGNDKKGSRKFRIEANVETPGADRTETKLLADIGLQVNNQELGGFLYQ
ncbi:MAG: DUF5309 domain-containing protein [Ignavibacteriales bacterium]|jgi:hypothetical protein|nr:DUF5309 domain-containing protein [Ignavibacteriales bacterium]